MDRNLKQKKDISKNNEILIKYGFYLIITFYVHMSCAGLLSHVQLCDPMDCSLPGFSVHGIFQAKITVVGCYFLLQGIFLTQG